MRFLLLVFLIAGCTEQSFETVRMTRSECLTNSDRKNLADFIIKCAKAANPLSDEEGEDLVQQCEKTGRNTICPPAPLCMTVEQPAGFMQPKRYGEWVPCKK